MAKYTPTTAASGYLSVPEINQNFTDAATAFENTLSRDGTSPNSMNADIDMNSNELLNVAQGSSPSSGARLKDITDAATITTTTAALTTYSPAGTGAVDRTQKSFNDQWVTPQNFGTNTTPGTTDMTDALTKALAASNTVYITEDILISSAITLADNQALIGSSWRDTVITLSGAATRINLSDWNTIADIRVNGDGNQTFGISMTATASRWLLDRVWVSNCITGIGLNNTWIGSIRDCLIRDCTNGIFAHDGLSSNGPVNAINIIGGEIAACTYGLRFGLNGGSAFGVNNFNLYGATIEPSGTYGVWVEDVGIGTINFDGCYFESCGDAIYRQDTGVNIARFKACYLALDNNAATDKGIDITAGTTHHLGFYDNEFDRGATSTATEAIDLGAGATVTHTLMQNNRKDDSALVVVNDAGSIVTYIADGFDLVGTNLPFQLSSHWRELVTGANTITASESGRVFYLNSTTGFDSALPAPANGLHFTFIIKTIPTSGNNTISTNAGANVLYGTYLDIVGELVYFSAQDTINFIASTSVIGDRLEVECDGTNWYCKAISGANGGITTSVT